ncbi:MAG: 4'-phosphopantetheinyl transferase superfamily protein [Deltaproteobacteria bacterium]|nr:MAG: 4'-phosphopantetheinyl transferase superfamily protein [Deltaproteobacteria bacterium]
MEKGECRLDEEILLLLERRDEIPEPGSFLSARELEQGKRWRHEGRRQQWLAGRYAAKGLVARWVGERAGSKPACHEILIIRAESGAPVVQCPPGEPLGISLSISHSGEYILCGLCPVEKGRLGVDMERPEPRSDAFWQDYFDEEERRLAQGHPGGSDAGINLLWCLKEAYLKALGTGLRESTGRIAVRALGPPATDGWGKAAVDAPEPVTAWWRIDDETGFCLAVALLPP